LASYPLLLVLRSDYTLFIFILTAAKQNEMEMEIAETNKLQRSSKRTKRQAQAAALHASPPPESRTQSNSLLSSIESLLETEQEDTEMLDAPTTSSDPLRDLLSVATGSLVYIEEIPIELRNVLFADDQSISSQPN
jgi:hypothetical protein